MVSTIIALAVVAVLVAADQVTKLLAVEYLTRGQSVHVINGLLDFTYVQNKGAAFGMLANQRWIFMVITTVIMAAIAWGWIKGYFTHITGRMSAVLIMAGGIGNMIDRIHLGYVVDFIDISPLFSFAVFNVADCCVTIGSVLLMVYIIFYMDEKKLGFGRSAAKKD